MDGLAELFGVTPGEMFYYGGLALAGVTVLLALVFLIFRPKYRPESATYVVEKRKRPKKDALPPSAGTAEPLDYWPESGGTEVLEAGGTEVLEPPAGGPDGAARPVERTGAEGYAGDPPARGKTDVL